MASTARTRFTSLINYVDQLISIHGRLQVGRGRRHDQDALHRAGVVMTVAAWEGYIEDVVMESLTALEQDAGAAGGAASPVPAWARHAFALRRAEIQASVRKFNTPNAVNVRDLCQTSLEFHPWAHWNWHAGPRQWDTKRMRDGLDGWMRVRHSVAHGAALPNDVDELKDAAGRIRLTLNAVRECKRFFEHIVDQTDGAMSTHLVQHHGLATAPW